MNTLIIPPDQSAYTETPGNSVVSVTLNGGRSRYRQDQLYSSSIITCQWTLGPSEYNYLRAFYRTASNNASAQFQVDLILDSAFPSTYIANFIPGSFKLDSVDGYTYIVVASMEVMPNDVDESFDENLLGVSELFGNIGNMQIYFNLLERLVNINLPKVK